MGRTERACVAVEIPPGPPGLDVLLPALAAALDGSGPAVGLIPGSGSAEYRDRIRAAVRPGDPLPDGIAVVASTSGSTGSPAGVQLPASALRAAAAGFAELTGHPGHQWVAALPLHHAGGLMVAVRSLLGGTRPIAVSGLGGAGPFTVDDFLAATESAQRRASSDAVPLAVSLVPAMVQLLAEAGAPGLRALRHYDVVLVGGAATPSALDARLTAEGVRLMRSYGMTETCGGAVFDGHPVAGMDVSVASGGRLRLTGPQVAGGYRDGRHPERWGVDAEGRRWFLTDDIGTVSTEGAVTVLGRRDDVVQVGGASVSLGAVADVLRADPRVAAAEVMAVPDERLGARLTAVVVPVRGACILPPDPEDGSRRRLVDSLADQVTTHLGRSARPRRIWLVRAIPMLESGKPDRQALTALVADPPSA